MRQEKMEEVSLNFSNTVLRYFVANCIILIAKILLLSFYTSFERYRWMAFSNTEDCVVLRVKPKVDENVERVRRAHLNDLENIIPFIIIGFIYTLTNPTEAWALLLFRTYTAMRIIHTTVYAVFVLPQPARAFSWGVGYAITWYMLLKSFLHFM